MKVTIITFVMAVVVVAIAMARPEGDQAQEQFSALLKANDAVIYDRDHPDDAAVRNTRQNIRWTGFARGPTVLIGGNFPDKQSCLRKCKQMDYPGVIFRNGMCRCRPPLMRTGEVEF